MLGGLALPPETPWKQATQKRKSMRSEDEAAKLSGGHRVAMSGGGRQKGDVVTATWLIEDKFTEMHGGKPAVSFRITLDMLRKTCLEALSSGRLPQWRITLPGFRLRVLREEDYLYLQAQADRNFEAKADVTDEA